ncbi:MAG: hypothetical protein AB7L92_09155 [Alphaproteobacteria bacterium]
MPSSLHNDAKSVLEHIVVPATGNDAAITFEKQMAEDIEYSDAPHQATKTLLDSLRALREGRNDAREKIRFEKNALPVIAAYEKKFKKLRDQARRLSTGQTPLAGLSSPSERQQVESGDMVGHWSVAVSTLEGLKSTAQNMARSAGLSLRNPDRDVT